MLPMQPLQLLLQWPLMDMLWELQLFMDTLPFQLFQLLLQPQLTMVLSLTLMVLWFLKTNLLWSKQELLISQPSLLWDIKKDTKDIVMDDQHQPTIK